ncbi:FHA domain-containing protein, partial [Mucuna pruriens]
MEEEEEAPTLRLEILQGPRQGESLEFRPGSAVRIGRVVKGNTLPIKDSGISSKHLSILTESAKWILRDLDSSNGTVLNGSKIPPHTPFTLHNDSTIKIGELTSIHVIFLPPQQQPAARPKRNPTRRDRTEPAQPVASRGRGRGRALKNRVQIQIQSVDENDACVVNAEPGRVDPPARVTRRSNRERSVAKVCGSGVEILDAPEEKVEEPKSTRNPNLIEISDSTVGNSGVPVEEPKNTRVTRNSKNARAVNGNANVNGSRNSGLECGVENVEKKKIKGVTEKRRLQKEGEDVYGVKETYDDGNWPDLNKITLDEWFDFLEVHLPKQIIDETEEMIDSMTKKAERLRQYIMEIQQRNDKAKMPVEYSLFSTCGSSVKDKHKSLESVRVKRPDDQSCLIKEAPTHDMSW